MKRWIRQVISRWKATTPKFFKGIAVFATCVSVTAISINTALLGAGASAPSWWSDIFPYLVGIPAGMAAVAKLTKDDK